MAVPFEIKSEGVALLINHYHSYNNCGGSGCAVMCCFTPSIYQALSTRQQWKEGRRLVMFDLNWLLLHFSNL